jgi:hypothetical protein
MIQTRPIGGRRWFRIIAIGVPTLAAAALSFAVSYAAVVQRQAPAQALVLWPSGEAKAGLAAQLLTQPDRDGSYARARRLAREALQRDPMSVRAASTLAFLAAEEGNAAQATRLLTYSERLSRRDLPTQLALIETKVQANDVVGALIHYDRALRTSKASEPILVPVLVSAVANPGIARSLAPLLAARADWWKPFTLQMIQQDTPPVGSYTLLHALKLDVRRGDERAMAVDAMQRMIGHGRVDLASRFYTELRGGHAGAFDRINDGGFRSVDRLPPFDWDLTNSGDLSATIETRPDGKGNGLFLVATNGASGRVARQLLILSPGRYALGFDVGVPPSGSRLTASARCNGSDTPLTSIRPAAAEKTQRIVMPFATSTACRNVWIEFSAQASEGMDTGAPWIGAVSVTSRSL